MPEPDPYATCFDEIVAEWAHDEETEYRKYYPQHPTREETNHDR